MLCDTGVTTSDAPRLYRRGRIWWTAFFRAGQRVRVSTRCADHVAATAKALELEREALGLGPMDDAQAALERAARIVYFVEGPGGAIKIGHTAALSERLSRVQMGSPTPLRVLCAIPGGPRMERALHVALNDYRMEGEWFRPALPVLALVREMVAIYGASPA